MEYNEIEVGMRVKINLDKNDKEYSEEYDGREGTVAFVGEPDYDEYCIDVNVVMLTGEIEVGILFKPSELEAVV